MIILLLLLTVDVLRATEVNYDEDISFPVPEVILNHSPIDVPAPYFLSQQHGCRCRENPSKYIACFGPQCRQVPVVNVTAPLFKFKLSSVTVLRRHDLEFLRNILYLEIESNTLLRYIEPGIFHNMSSLLNLTISFNEKLNYLDEDVFEGLTNLSTLILQKNGFYRVIDITVSLSPYYVPNLFLLKLNENKFPRIEKHDFWPMNGTKLQQLNMILCQIEYIHPECLKPLKYLNTLRLGQNHLPPNVISDLLIKSTDFKIPLDNINFYGMGFRKNIPLSVLQAVGYSTIRYLHLTMNHFDEITDDTFPYMPNLTDLSLRSNDIRYISKNAFKRLINVSTIFLTGNRLVEVPEAVLLPTVKDLDLAGNTLHLSYHSYFYIPDEIFKNMKNLQWLSLAYNNINSLNKFSFVGLENLTKLNLKNTTLTSIRSGSFMHLKNLKLLNLINNPFPKYMFLKSDLFQGLDNLEILLLGGCKIRNLSMNPSLFTYTKNLKYLGLERNEIFVINNQFYNLNNLKSLNINNNKLPSWNKRIFGQNSSLKIFSAISNKFTFISTAMLEDWSTLENLYLEENPFTCDCSLYSVVLWFKNHESLIKNSDESIIASCVGPAFWRQRSIVDYLSLLYSNATICEIKTKISVETIIFIILFTFIIFVFCIFVYIFRYSIEYGLYNIRRKKYNKLYSWDVYVSYSSKDEWFIKLLIQNLEPNIKLFIFERDILIGQSKTSAIAEAISSSKFSLLLISENYLKSSWNKWEVQLTARKSPIVIQLETIDMKNASPLLRYLLKTRIYLVWPQQDDRKDIFWNKLKTALAK